MLIIKKIAFVCLIFLGFTVISQTKPSPKLYAKDLKNATIYFDTEDYLNAINAYKKVLEIDPNHEKANLNTIISRIKMNQPIDSCYKYLVKIKNSKLPETQFYFGKIYHLSSNFDEAILCFDKYKAIPIKQRTITDAEVNYNIGCSINAKEFLTNPHRALIKNVGKPINSAYADYVPLITPDEKVMYFTSRRPGGDGNVLDEYGNSFEDIYVTTKLDNNTWSEPKNMGTPINTKTHDACVALSFDGNQLMIYRTSPDIVSGDLFVTRTDYEGWSEPKKYGSEINTPFVETSACYSNDTSVIYLSSNKPGGYGGKDLYRVKKLPNGKWSLPQNLGKDVNTDKDEDAPFLHPDGFTLYFSSKGHNSMGEYDVFKTIANVETNKFSAPTNLGSPINTVNSDIFFVLNANGTRGYYSSIREDSYGGSDIYQIDTRFGDNDLKVKHGRIIFANNPQKAKITLIDIENKTVSGIFNASPKTGNFLLIMNPLKQYKAIIEEEGFQTMIHEIEPLVKERDDIDLIFSLTKKK